jgi:HD superfamily phosphodiesterase
MCKRKRGAEGKWLPVIRPFFEHLSEGRWMPSHDFDHHRRVWRNACEFAGNMNPVDEFFYEKLILACFFHDTGLLYDITSKHGAESRRICENFLTIHTEKIPFECQNLLEAIENHDNKEYGHSSPLPYNAIYHLLSKADDLDAFGALGAYRYTEIYLMREIETMEMPEMVLLNAERRFENLLKPENHLDPILKADIIEKFNILKRLFTAGSFAESPLSLIEWIKKKVVEPRRNPWIFFKKASMNSTGNRRVSFFLERLVEECREM